MTGPQVEAVMTRGESVWFEEVHIPIERHGRLDDAWWTYGLQPRARRRRTHCRDARRRARSRRPRVLARRELVAERARAEAANRAKSDFLAVMSHELRTPLNAIGGYADLMELGLLGPVTAEQRDGLERMQRSQRHLLGLINGVLNYAKIDAGAVEYSASKTFRWRTFSRRAKRWWHRRRARRSCYLRVEPVRPRDRGSRRPRKSAADRAQPPEQCGEVHGPPGGSVTVDCSANARRTDRGSRRRHRDAGLPKRPASECSNPSCRSIGN